MDMLQAKHVECNDFNKHWQTHTSKAGQNHENESKRSGVQKQEQEETSGKVIQTDNKCGKQTRKGRSQTTGESNQGGADDQGGGNRDRKAKGDKEERDFQNKTGNKACVPKYNSHPKHWKWPFELKQWRLTWLYKHNSMSSGTNCLNSCFTKHPNRSGCVNTSNVPLKWFTGLYHAIMWQFIQWAIRTSQRYSSCLLIISTNCKNIAVMCLVVLCIFSFIPSCKERICPSSLQSGDLIWWKELQYLVKKQRGDLNLFSNFLNLISPILSAWAGVQTGNGGIRQKFLQMWRWNAGM